MSLIIYEVVEWYQNEEMTDPETFVEERFLDKKVAEEFMKLLADKNEDNDYYYDIPPEIVHESVEECLANDLYNRHGLKEV